MKLREPKLVRVAVTVQEREHLTLLRMLNRVLGDEVEIKSK